MFSSSNVANLLLLNPPSSQASASFFGLPDLQLCRQILAQDCNTFLSQQIMDHDDKMASNYQLIEQLKRDPFDDHSLEHQFPKQNFTRTKNGPSKIATSHGLRNRRVRISVDVAHKFFGLQDMLGFDKPSKTLDWLITNSQPAIQELLKVKNLSFLAETEVHTGPYEACGIDSSKGDPRRMCRNLRAPKSEGKLTREYLRAKARARARERTRIKMCIPKIKKTNINVHPVLAYQVPMGEEEIFSIKRKIKNSAFLGFQQQDLALDAEYVIPSNSNVFPIIGDLASCSDIMVSANGYTMVAEEDLQIEPAGITGQL